MQTGDEAAVFVVKLHNAVNTCIEDRQHCRTLEGYEVAHSPGFRCAVWPWAKRFQFALRNPSSWARSGARD